MSTVKLQIDGREITAPEGATILDVTKSAGIEIPRLCHMEGLTPNAACRLCVVEVAGSRNLVASCSFPVSNNMVVKTNSERVAKARRLVMELLLSDHPLDCMTCEKSGACDLEKYAYELGVSSTRFEGERHAYPLDESNPFIVRDYNKCILCGRCVSACNEVQFVGAINVAHRGFDTKVAAPFGRSLLDSTCTFCGQCVAVCPVGALIENTRRFQGREWELDKVATVCPYCGVGCNIELNVKNNRVVKVVPLNNAAVNQGTLCVKGKFGMDFVGSPDRLTTPLIRRDGQLIPAPWEEAYDLIAAKFSQIKGESGPDAFAFLSSARTTNESNYMMQKFARAVIGTNSVDNCART
ncbi:MAG: formate dehydrogenase, alpha subunit [Dehalococcoidia bacterium]|nr:formate dehydrogenase, alpha subunit [Dehalococcoidia bacterium]